MDADWSATLQQHLGQKSRITVLTGAGISAESGIPTFRGPEGYWTVGSNVYQPQEMATHAMFRRQPDAVWQWYLHRAAICHKAAPNAGHDAVAEMDRLLDERFTLITQNVDGLHLSAPVARIQKTFQIHGNVFQVRCAAACSPELQPLPIRSSSVARQRGPAWTDTEQRSFDLSGAAVDRLRPHVLWFDEVYDEALFSFRQQPPNRRRDRSAA